MRPDARAEEERDGGLEVVGRSDRDLLALQRLTPVSRGLTALASLPLAAPLREELPQVDPSAAATLAIPVTGSRHRFEPPARLCSPFRRARGISQRAMPATQTNPVHFEDFSAIAFERLVFAFHLRAEHWRSLDWYGQVGSDLGRDILGVRDDDAASGGEVVCIQCANHRILPAKKAIRDSDKALSSPTTPTRMRFVCGGNVSAKTRDRILKHAMAAKLHCEVWSGTEFEERVRSTAESLLRRFVEGVEFPDAPAELTDLVRDLPASNDAEVIGLLARLLDRPAFYTPFAHESSLPAFREALDDTIRALGTGVRQTRDGHVLPRIPSRHDLRDADAREVFGQIERGVARLRARFDQLVGSGGIRPCAEHCGDPNCPVYTLSDAVIADMDEIRSRILEEVQRVHPDFKVRVGWG